MKNFLESLAIFLVGVLSIGIVYLIIQYNMIQDENMLNNVLTELAEPVEESSKTKEESYLENLEGYEDADIDLDEDVDVTQESTTNTVTVVAEETESALDDAVEDTSKSSYMENLENYQEAEPAANVDATKESLENTVTVESDEKSALEEVVEDKSKSSYTENLENYKAPEPAAHEAAPTGDSSGEPQKLEHDEIVDEVGMAIDAALEDL